MANRTKKKPKDVVVDWWTDYKKLIGLVAGLLAIIGFLFQFVLSPLAEKKVLKAQIEFLTIRQKLEAQYLSQIDSLKRIINRKESELSVLKERLADLQKHGFDKREIELLKQEIALKEKEIRFYRVIISSLKIQIKQNQNITEPWSSNPKVKKFLNYSNKELPEEHIWPDTSTFITDLLSEFVSEEIAEGEIIDTNLVVPILPPPPKPDVEIETETVDIPEDEIIDTTKLALPKLPPQPSPPVEIVTLFRSQPMPLSVDDVKAMLKKYDFFCKEYSWTKDYCNPNGQGFKNEFELQKKGQVVYDKASGLMWQQSGSTKYMEYQEAKKWIDDLNQKGFAGYHDWRLPTLEEAMSLVEPKKMNGNLYIDPIFDQKQWWIWTSDQVKGESWAWVVSFDVGYCFYGLFDYSFHVRALRSGQSSGGH